MNHIGGIIPEFINLFNQQIEKLIQSRNIYFFEGRVSKSPKLYGKLCVSLRHSSDSQIGLRPKKRSKYIITFRKYIKCYLIASMRNKWKS